MTDHIPSAPKPPPPFVGGPRPRGEDFCSRWMGEACCGKPATQHVLWTDDMENGFCCAEHYEEALERWAMVDHHKFAGFCGMPETDWHNSWDQPNGEGFCAFPLEDEGTIEAVVSSEVDDFQRQTEVVR